MMQKKKLIGSLAALALMTFSVWAGEAATFSYPGWGCKDVALLQEQLALAPDNFKVLLTYQLDYVQNGAPGTFAEALQRIDEVFDSVDAEIKEEHKLRMRKQFLRFSGKFAPELIAFCKANPDSYDFHIGLRDKTGWGFQVVSEGLLKYRFSAEQAMMGVIYLNQQAIALEKDDGEMLSLWRKLNRMFSALLLEDETWEKVVAQVRTLMETYE